LHIIYQRNFYLTVQTVTIPNRGLRREREREREREEGVGEEREGEKVILPAIFCCCEEGGLR
jgi:hypothetical protein